MSLSAAAAVVGTMPVPMPKPKLRANTTKAKEQDVQVQELPLRFNVRSTPQGHEAEGQSTYRSRRQLAGQSTCSRSRRQLAGHSTCPTRRQRDGQSNSNCPSTTRVGSEALVLKARRIPFSQCHCHGWENHDNEPVRKLCAEPGTMPAKLYVDRISTVTGNHARVPRVHLYIRGAPCQKDYTLGKNRGASDDGSVPLRLRLLFVESLSLKYISRQKPTVSENVPNPASSQSQSQCHREVFAKVLKSSVQNADYVVDFRVVNTMVNRPRLYVLEVQRRSMATATKPTKIPYRLTGGVRSSTGRAATVPGRAVQNNTATAVRALRAASAACKVKAIDI